MEVQSCRCSQVTDAGGCKRRRRPQQLRLSSFPVFGGLVEGGGLEGMLLGTWYLAKYLALGYEILEILEILG